MKLYDKKTGNEIEPLMALSFLAMTFDLAGDKTNARRTRKMAALFGKLSPLSDEDRAMIAKVVVASVPDAIEAR